MNGLSSFLRDTSFLLGRNRVKGVELSFLKTIRWAIWNASREVGLFQRDGKRGMDSEGEGRTGVWTHRDVVKYLNGSGIWMLFEGNGTVLGGQYR